METIMRKTILAIALASGCLVGLPAAALAQAAPQTLNPDDLARPQAGGGSGHTLSIGPRRYNQASPRQRLYDQVSPQQPATSGGYDGWVSVPTAAGH
jgi:hypothetical protein